MRCDACNRRLTRPGIECQIGNRQAILGPVCARKALGKPKRREAVIPRTRYRAGRVDQLELFGVVA